MLELTPEQRKYLKAQGHSLKPVVMIGNAGLSEAVVQETDRALLAHELIKVRVLGDDRAAREAWFMELCEALDAAPVQHIGKLLLIYRASDKAKIKLP
jgi:RNA-binding protein